VLFAFPTGLTLLFDALISASVASF